MIIELEVLARFESNREALGVYECTETKANHNHSSSINGIRLELPIGSSD